MCTREKQIGGCVRSKTICTRKSNGSPWMSPGDGWIFQGPVLYRVSKNDLDRVPGGRTEASKLSGFGCLQVATKATEDLRAPKHTQPGEGMTRSFQRWVPKPSAGQCSQSTS